MNNPMFKMNPRMVVKRRVAYHKPVDFLLHELAVDDHVICVGNQTLELGKILKINTEKGEAKVHWNWDQTKMNGDPYILTRVFSELVKVNELDLTRYILVK